MRRDARQTRIERELDETRTDAVLEEALKDFRLSVHAWSESAMNRPRRPMHSAVRTTWRLAVTWAVGCLLAVGSVGGGLYERHHRQEMARQAEAEKVRQGQRAAEAAAATPQEQGEAASTREEDEQLLAEIDSAVSRQVPSAMEPLAFLMEGSGEE
jgi:hypothetical protein